MKLNDSIEKDNSRITYIDTLKCVAILLTVLGHILIYYRGVGNSNPMLLMLICTFHMPAFFIVSGVVFNTKKWLGKSFKDFLLSRMKTLVVPYLLFDIFGGLMNMILNHLVSLKEILNIIKKTFSYQPNVGPNWFLPAMFIASVLFYLFIKHHDKFFKYIVFIPVLLIGFRNFPLNDTIIFIFRGIIGFTFMYIGYVLKEYFLEDYNKRFDVMIVSFLLLKMVTVWNGQIDIWNCTISNPVYFLLGGIVGTFFIFGVSKHIDNAFFQFIGRNTIPILGTHSILIGPVYSLLNIGNSNISLVITFIVVLVIELPVIYLYSKFISPLILKKRHG